VSNRTSSGPMLVLHGSADAVVHYSVTAAAVEHTCALYPGSQIKFAVMEGTSHVPALYAGQQVWLEFIADRFMGVRATEGCSVRSYTSLRKVETYQAELAYYLQIALEDYVVALLVRRGNARALD